MQGIKDSALCTNPHYDEVLTFKFSIESKLILNFKLLILN
jgi:hypothetical protein